MPDERKEPERDPDERVAIPLDPEEALRGLLKVDPDAPPPEGSAANNPSDAPQRPD